MARNIEIKARVPDLQALRVRAAQEADGGPVEIHQDDTFFTCHAARLKLRAFSEAEGELIFYRRADVAGPKESFYLRSPTPVPSLLRESLSLAYGVTGRVRKQRTLFLSGRTRIHLDQVEGLGDFLELEVVLRDGEAPQAGALEAMQLMERLGVDPSQLVDKAYVDLLATPSGPTSGQEVAVLEAALLRADVRASRERLGELLAEDFREFGSSGRTFDKAQLIAALRDEPPGSEQEMHDVQVRTLSSTVVLVTYKVRFRGGASGATLRSSVWEYRDGHWRMTFHQGTAALQD